MWHQPIFKQSVLKQGMRFKDSTKLLLRYNVPSKRLQNLGHPEHLANHARLMLENGLISSVTFTSMEMLCMARASFLSISRAIFPILLNHDLQSLIHSF